MLVDWAEAEAVLREWLGQAERDLEEAAGELYIGRSQGRIKAIRAFMVLPKIIEGRLAERAAQAKETAAGAAR